LEIHELKCTDEQQVNSRQKVYGGKNDEINVLSDMFNLDFNNYPQEHFATFDIETFKRGGILVPVSIAVSSTLEDPKYFERSNDDPESGFKMVTKFLDYLQYLQRLLMETIPTEIHSVLEQLERRKDDPGKYDQSDDPKYKASKQNQTLYNYVQNYFVLKVFGFNSRKVLIHFVQYMFSFMYWLMF